VELEFLALGGQRALELGDLIRSRVLVVSAEQSEERAPEVADPIAEGPIRSGNSSGGGVSTKAP